MKAKHCSNPNCDYVGTLYKSRPALCKNCAMKYEYQNKEKVSENGLNKAIEVKKYVIPKFSEKQAKINALYSVLSRQYLKDNTECRVMFGDCSRVATDVHHLASGSNKRKYYLDTTTWMPTCRNCHSKIHDKLSSDELYELGLKIRT